MLITHFDSTNKLGNLISISHSLNHNITIRLADRPYILERDRVFSDKFILNPPQEWLDLIEKENKFKIEEVYRGKVEDPASEFNFSLLRIL